MWQTVAIASMIVNVCLGIWIVLLHGAAPVAKNDLDREYFRRKFQDDDGEETRL